METGSIKLSNLALPSGSRRGGARVITRLSSAKSGRRPPVSHGNENVARIRHSSRDYMSQSLEGISLLVLEALSFCSSN
ncbi:hypothetical protein RRG08_030129 [Elysia crispata]|uniref:Uncharacterized protein n=1 Tax=Elysia crispata TaxID=231223 RepID=A0AAE1DKQ4_9GAST|nr:hypothetical protein RRG08_030129 [Elysia crispata]